MRFVYMRHGANCTTGGSGPTRGASSLIFHRYAAEAVALLEGLFHTGGPPAPRSFDDGGVREDAQTWPP